MSGKPEAMLREYFSFDRDLDNLFAESGRQAHVVWRLDGSFGGLRAVSSEIVNPPGGGTEGIWAEPLRLADYVHLHVWDKDGGLSNVERGAKRYTRRVGSSEIFSQFSAQPWLTLLKTIWVPLLGPAVVIDARLSNISDSERAVRLFVELKTHLSIGWPLREGGKNTAFYDPTLPGIVAHDDEHPQWTALCALSHSPEATRAGDFQPRHLATGGLETALGRTTEPADGRSCMQIGLTIPPDAHVDVAIVVCGNPTSEASARETCAHVLGHGAELKEEKLRHYQEIFSEKAVLATPSYVFNKAFLWAKTGTEDFKHDDPRLGFLFFAGYPAYNFFFASDTMLILRGSFAFGDFEDAKRILRSIVRYQATSKGRDTLPGEIWHEMSTTGDRISPNFAGFLFPGVIRSFFEWSGDRDFLHEMYPHARAVIEWGYLNDLNGDGLLENGPEGEMADSASEDRNVERSHYTVQVQWLDALREGIVLAGHVGDTESAQRWSDTQAALALVVNNRYWNEAEGIFEETLRPEGCLDTSGKGLANLDASMVDAGKAAVTARLLLDEEAYLEDVQAFAARQRFEETFSTNRSYMSWYVMERGRRVLQLYRTHRAEQAYHALEQIAATPFHWTTPGMWPEVWAVDEPSVLRARGCFHQAWTGSHGFIYPVVDGLLGIRPDAPHRRLTFAPHAPPHWPRFGIRRMRLAEGWFDVECTQGEGWRKLSVRNDGAAALNISLGFVLPRDVRIRSLRIDGQPRPTEDVHLNETPSDVHAILETISAPGSEVSAELRWEPAAIELEILPGRETTSPAAYALILPRTQPGTTRPITTRIRNHSYAACEGILEIQAEGDDVRSTPKEAPFRLSPGEESLISFIVQVPKGASEGYRTIHVRQRADASTSVARTAYLPVYPSLALRLEARQVARAGKPFQLQVLADNLADKAIDADIAVEWPARWRGESSGKISSIPSGTRGAASFEALPSGSGDCTVRIRVSHAAGDESWDLEHAVRVLGTERKLILHSGFLRCPILCDESQEVVNIPANYALRKPRVLEQLLAQADLLLTSDQHDGVFSKAQIESIMRFVYEGGSLVFFCHWSAPWGRGYFSTFGNFAASALTEILPLRMRKGIVHANTVRLTPHGQEVYGGLAWKTIPPFDHNAADLAESAQLLAASETGAPLIAESRHGDGRVLAIAIDCFGFESYVEGLSFDFWSEKPKLIQRSVDWVLGGSAHTLPV